MSESAVRETSADPPIICLYGVSLNADGAGPGGKHIVWKFELSPWTSNLGSLARWTRPIRILQNGTWEGIEMIVSAPQTLSSRVWIFRPSLLLERLLVEELLD